MGDGAGFRDLVIGLLLIGVAGLAGWASKLNASVSTLKERVAWLEAKANGKDKH